MTEIDRMDEQLRRAWDGEAWHGPALRQALKDIAAAEAAARPLANAHSIWELVHHITTWEDAIRRRLEGETPNVTPEMDWPPVTDTSEAAWRRALDALERAHRALAGTIARFDPEQLDEKHASGSSAYTMIHGIIQHYA